MKLQPGDIVAVAPEQIYWEPRDTPMIVHMAYTDPWNPQDEGVVVCFVAEACRVWITLAEEHLTFLRKSTPEEMAKLEAHIAEEADPRNFKFA